MARIRTIKPEFFTSLTVANLPIEARLTFIGLWTHADDEGRCVDDARLIKAALWPLDDRVSTDVEADLRILTESSLILRYKVGGRSFMAVRGWDEHQRINRPTKSRFPPPPPPGESQPDTPPPPSTEPLPVETVTPPIPTAPIIEASLAAHAQLTEDSLAERNREQGTGNRERNRELTLPPSAGACAPSFELAEIIDERPAALVLIDVPGTALAEIPNAGVLNAQWIDHCTRHGVKLTKTLITRYGKGIKLALEQGFDPLLIKRALAQMLDDGEASRPSYLDNFIVRVQQGPARRPRRLTPGEESVANLASGNAQVIHLAAHFFDQEVS